MWSKFLSLNSQEILMSWGCHRPFVPKYKFTHRQTCAHGAAVCCDAELSVRLRLCFTSRPSLLTFFTSSSLKPQMSKCMKQSWIILHPTPQHRLSSIFMNGSKSKLFIFNIFMQILLFISFVSYCQSHSWMNAREVISFLSFTQNMIKFILKELLLRTSETFLWGPCSYDYRIIPLDMAAAKVVLKSHFVKFQRLLQSVGHMMRLTGF